MFGFKKNLLFILCFGLFFIVAQSAYSNTSNNFHCVKDGKTCDFINLGRNYVAQNGDACLRKTANMSTEEYIRMINDFHSKYCKPNPAKLKKYSCSSDSGEVSVYMQEGRVVAVADYSFLSTERLQSYYAPDKCTEIEIEEDAEAPIEQSNQNDKLNDTQNYSQDDSNQFESVNNTILQSVREEIAPLDEKINYLQKEIETLKNENNALKQYYQYIFIILVIVLVISLAAIYKSNQNPDKRL